MTILFIAGWLNLRRRARLPEWKQSSKPGKQVESPKASLKNEVH